jgi:hypothetical protein
MSQMIDQRLLSRIRKLGDYVGEIFQLICELDQFQRADLLSMVIEQVGALVAGIRHISPLRQVRPPRQETATIQKSSVEILNQWAMQPGLQGPLLTAEDLRQEFPSLPASLSANNTVTHSVHCECTPLMHLVKGPLVQGETTGIHVLIGVSKSVCVLCGVFMDLIMRPYPHIKITVSSNHGKNVAGWRVPPSIPPTVLAGLHDHINSTIAEIRHKPIPERRSKSEPRGLADDILEENPIVKANCKRPPSWTSERTNF